MKTISFTKMEGAGNDFIILDNQTGLNIKRIAVKICARTTGIGADGLLVCQKSKKADFRMRIINADGSEAEMCGNGARCMAAYIAVTRRPKKKEFTLETISGVIKAKYWPTQVEITLNKPKEYKAVIPLNLHGQKINVSYIDTGVPHTVVFVDGLKKINVNRIAPLIRWHKKFAPRGTNVNFVEQRGKDKVTVRTFERGVEAETRACGTGAVASGLVTYLRSYPDLPDRKNAKVDVLTQSGETLHLTFDSHMKKIKNIRLKGSAHFIAKGEYYV